MLALAGMTVADWLFTAAPAWADDGGCFECGQSWQQWWSNCTGSEGVRGAATVGGAAAAAGGVAGAFVGEAAGGSIKSQGETPRD